MSQTNINRLIDELAAKQREQQLGTRSRESREGDLRPGAAPAGGRRPRRPRRQREDLRRRGRREGEVRALVDGLAAQRDREHARIEGDRNLSEVGRQTKKDEADTSVMTAVRTWMAKNVGAWDVRIAADEAKQLAPAPKPQLSEIERLIREIRFQGIRNQAATLSDQQRKDVYFTTDSDEVREAFETAPPMLRGTGFKGKLEIRPLVAPEDVRQRRLDEARITNPEGIAELSDFRRVRDVLRAVAETALRRLEQASPANRGTSPAREAIAADNQPAFLLSPDGTTLDQQ